MTASMINQHPLLRDIRLSAFGVYREERQAPVADTEEQRRRIEHEAYKRGVAAATAACEDRVARLREELEQRHREEVGVLIERMSEGISVRLSEHLEHLERGLVQLTVEAVSKIVGGLPITVDMIEASLRETLGSALGTPVVRVLLHPEDLALLESAGTTGMRSICAGRGIRLESDPSVDRGGCLVETEAGTVDGRRSSRVASFRQALEGA
jgi:flagellar assembly protein FliH